MIITCPNCQFTANTKTDPQPMKPINIEALYSKLAKTGSLTGFRPRDRFVRAVLASGMNPTQSPTHSLRKYPTNFKAYNNGLK